MADSRGMMGLGEDPPGDRSTPLRRANPDTLALLKADRTVPRASLYFFCFLVLLVGAVGPLSPPSVLNPEVHNLLEGLATLLGFVVGALALVRFYTKKEGTFLLLGTGFLGSGVLDIFHLWISMGAGQAEATRNFQNISALSFTASGAYLSIFLLGSWAAWKLAGRQEGSGTIREIPVYLAAGTLVALLLLLLFWLPETIAFFPDSFILQPAELFPAVIFLLALFGYLAKGHWRYDAFEHWMVMALVIAFMAHGAFMPFSASSNDAGFLGAHLLKVLGHVCVLVGLMASVYVTFRREEEAAEFAQSANTALASEIDFRRKAERVLQESEERLQDFLDNAHDLIQSVAPDGSFLYVNRAWMDVLGYTPQEVQGLNFYDVIHPTCRDRCARQFRAALDGEVQPAVEVDFLTADRRVVRCSGSANARFQDGVAVATRSILRDITSQTETRRELEAFQANLQALVENTGDAIWSVDRSLRLITFNTAFSMALEARTGREPLVQDLPEDVFPHRDAVWYREMYQKSLRGAAFSDFRDEEIGGQERSFELFFNPIREAMGITGVAVFGKDVTARRQTQVALHMAKEEAERASVAKSQFLANMSHELRTPLNSVIGFTNILSKNKGGHLTDQEMNFLQRISANGRHLLQLINQVLDLAKIEAGRMELQLETVDLRALIDETLSQMEAQVKEKTVSLRAVVPKEITSMATDGGKLKQVIINLVGNAIKFTESGEVSVEVVPLGSTGAVAEIVVKDSGIGIPPERLRAIFEAFQQADGTTSRRFGGTGLGLTISRSLCQLMGYELKVESEDGRGSTFSILTDRSVQSPARAEDVLMAEALRPMESSKPLEKKEDPEERSEGNGTVLIIDDDADSRLLMAQHLEGLGCDILTAGSAGDGLQQARVYRPDLILLDLMMPGVTGWEALREFKDDPDLRTIPVVIVSMVPEEEDRSRLLGALDVLPKPIEREKLLAVVNRNLDETRPREILVVEDDADTRTVIREYLEEAGIGVSLAENGEEGEEILRNQAPDAILLDLMMPIMDGATFLRRLREDEKYRGIPVIVCTGKELTAEDQENLQARAAGVITKGESFEADLREVLSRFFPLLPASGSKG